MNEAAVVIDASALVELLNLTPKGSAVDARLADREVHAPAHLESEVLSAFGRMNRAGILAADLVAERLGRLIDLPLERHPLGPLIAGAWERRHNLRLADALYVELAERLDCLVITTDGPLAAATPNAELVTA